MGTLRIMGPDTGDEHLTWDPKNEESVTDARKRFNQLVKPKTKGKGAIRYLAYKVTHVPHRTGDPIQEFDPSAGEILLVPQMAGG